MIRMNFDSPICGVVPKYYHVGLREIPIALVSKNVWEEMDRWNLKRGLRPDLGLIYREKLSYLTHLSGKTFIPQAAII